MKKSFISTIITILFFSSIQAQDPQPSFTLNELILPNTSKDYLARDYIDMLEGFEATPDDNNSVIAHIDPFLLFPPDNGGTGGPDPGDDGLVGSLGGTISVSDIGSAGYTIPINVSPGTKGMQPNLSIAYNSMAGNGVMGIGWNIAGISSISRVGRTYYHNDIIDGIDFDDDDQYAIDGQRMILLTGQHGGDGSTYGTEYENFTQFTSVGSAGNGPASFLAITKTGLFMEFGGTTDSRIEAQGRFDGTVRVWNINKIWDIKGNYIEFFYTEDNNTGEFNILKIEYTGNDAIGQNPYCSVEFEYSTGRSDHNTLFVAGSKVKMRHRLDNIYCKYEQQIYRHYHFNYEEDFYTHLKEITVFNVDGEHYNPTEIIWNPAIETFTYEVSSISSDINGYDYNIGDFNGDGKSDYVRVPRGSSFAPDDEWELFINQDGTNFTKVNSGLLSDLSSYHFSFAGNEYYRGRFLQQNLDFNGDGRSDLLWVTELREPGVCESDVFYQYSILRSTVDNDFVYDHTFGTLYNCEPFDNVLPGDYNGDGKTDLIVGSGSAFILQLAGSGAYPVPQIIIQGFSGSNEYIAGEFNGDGKEDLLVISEYGSEVLEYNINSEEFEALNESMLGYPTSWHFVRTGDFNGDGIADILTWTDYNGIGWEIAYFNGKEWQTGNCPSLNSTNPESNSFNHNYYVSDFNGDGKSDILELYKKEDQYEEMHVYYNLFCSNGLGFTEENYNFYNKHLYEKNYFFGDFIGDGKLNCMYRPRYTSGHDTIMILSFHEGEQNHFIESIKDEYNNSTELVFEPITNSDIYTKGDNFDYGDIFDFQGPFYVVTKKMEDNGLGSALKTEYRYEEAIIHRKGKGLLGFKKVISESEDIFSKVVKEFDYNSVYYFMFPEKTRVYELVQSSEILLTQTQFSTSYHLFNPPESKRLFLYNSKTQTNNYRVDHNSVNYLNTQRIYNILETGDLEHGNLTEEIVLTDENNLNFNDLDDLFEYKSTVSYTYTPVTIESGFLPHWLTESVTATKESSDPDDIHTEFSINSYYSTGHEHFPLLEKKTYVPNNSLELSLETVYDYDEFGNTEEVVLTAPNTIPAVNERKENYYYEDGKGRFLTKHKMIVNNILHEKEYLYEPESGSVFISLNENDLITEYHYDGFDRLCKTIFPDQTQSGHVLRWADGHVDNPGNALYYSWLCESGSSEVLVFYDKLGKEVRKVSWNFDQTRKIYTDKEYNRLGQLSLVKEPYFSDQGSLLETSFLYNKVGMVSITTTPVSTISNTYNGRETITVNSGTGQTKEVTKNALGQIELSVDAGGTIDYQYFSSGNLKSLSYNDDNPLTPITETSFTYNGAGYQKTLDDPSGGLTTYDYNAFGDLVEQIDAEGNIYILTYDELGRVLSKTFDANNETTTFVYDIKDNGIGLVSDINGYNGISTSYTYDELSRLNTLSQYIDNNLYQTQYDYNIFGNIYKIIYPSGFAIKKYYMNGVLSRIKRSDNNNPIWTLQDMTEQGIVSKYSQGNGLVTIKTIDGYGFPERIECGNIMDLRFDFDPPTGNLNYREDALNAIREDFSYDDDSFNSRLETWQVQNQSAFEILYENNGNIDTKSDVGDYQYGGAIGSNASVYAVERVNLPEPEFTAEASTQQVEYTEFNKVERITDFDSGYSLEFTYSPSEERKITNRYYTDGVTTTLQSKKVFVNGMYEVEADGAGNERHLHYISAGDGVQAIYVEEEETEVIYYIHKDYMGSLYAISDNTGNIAEYNEQDQVFSFDPWGLRRNPTDWTFDNVPTEFLFDFGFTGHEHLDDFEIVNMGGRIYDPRIGRFYSPDNYIQGLTSSQSLNRYSYANNNPLKYVDPDGNNPLLLAAIVFGATVGGIQGYWQAHSTGYRGVDLIGPTLTGMAFGAITGTAGYYAGGGSGLIVNTGIESMGAIGGSISGMLNGAISGSLSGAINGYAWTGTLKGAWQGMLQGAVVGAGTGFVVGFISGGIATKSGGRRFIDGRLKVENEYTTISTNSQLNLTGSGNMDCVSSTFADQDQHHGGSLTPSDVRDPQKFPSTPSNPQDPQYVSDVVNDYNNYPNAAATAERFLPEESGVQTPESIYNNMETGTTMGITKDNQGSIQDSQGRNIDHTVSVVRAAPLNVYNHKGKLVKTEYNIYVFDRNYPNTPIPISNGEIRRAVNYIFFYPR
jgi:RHS repeat-associated protein